MRDHGIVILNVKTDKLYDDQVVCEFLHEFFQTVSIWSFVLTMNSVAFIYAAFLLQIHLHVTKSRKVLFHYSGGFVNDMMQSVYTLEIDEEQVDQAHSSISYFGRLKPFWDDFVRQISSSGNFFCIF